MPARMSRAGGTRKRPVRYAPGDDPVGMAEARHAHKKGDLGRAREGYQRVLAAHPGCLDAWMNLGSLAVSVGHAREAREAFAQARALGPDDARVLRDLGVGLAAVGYLDEGRAALEESLQLDPSPLGPRLSLARLCAESGDSLSAVEHARRAVDLDPASAPAHLELARALFDDLAPDPSVAAARRAVDLDPEHALARYFLAGALRHAGRPDDSRDALGPPGLVAPGLVDALSHALDRPEHPRAFATKRATLQHALSLATRPGAVVELGVRHAVTTRVLAAGAAEVHGFDTFHGLPEAWQARAPGAFSTAGELPEVPAHVQLHVGLFADTLPGFVARHPAPLRLIHIDSDLYTSAHTALFTLAPLVRPGCVLVFDQLLGNASWRDDEHRALVEATQAFGWRTREPVLGWITGQGVVVIEALDDPGPPGQVGSNSSHDRE